MVETELNYTKELIGKNIDKVRSNHEFAQEVEQNADELATDAAKFRASTESGCLKGCM